MPNFLYISSAQPIEKAIENLVFSRYVDRGDPVVMDFDKTDITADGAWHDLDLSVIVPAGAKLVDIAFEIQNDTIGLYVMLRRHGGVGTANILRQYIQRSAVNIRQRGFVVLDVDRIIEYWASSTTWTMINITVCGWII